MRKRVKKFQRMIQKIRTMESVQNNLKILLNLRRRKKNRVLNKKGFRRRRL